MPRASLFIQRPEDASRHINMLARGLKQIGVAGAVAGAGCTVLAVFVSHYLGIRGNPSSTTPGVREMSGIVLVTWFLAVALLAFSSLYFLVGWGLAHQKRWARYAAAATFLGKVLLCVFLGRGSLPAMILFLTIASWDLYGLWVLLSKETRQLFSSSAASTAGVKPANLVT